jgi:cephalosporin hydroxylase
MGHQTWQSVFDAWTFAEVIADVKPELIIECGTYQGGRPSTTLETGRFLVSHSPMGWLRRR